MTKYHSLFIIDFDRLLHVSIYTVFEFTHEPILVFQKSMNIIETLASSFSFCEMEKGYKERENKMY